MSDFSNIDDILDLKMQENDAGANTIRDYFKALLTTMWNEKEGFSGKRPFGNSGWEYDLFKTLIKHGVVDGTLDEYDDIENFDEESADQVIFDCINGLFLRKKK